MKKFVYDLRDIPIIDLLLIRHRFVIRKMIYVALLSRE